MSLPKRKAGRPSKSQLATRTNHEVAAAEAIDGAKIITNHRADCVRLRKVLKAAEKLEAPTPSDAQRLTATTKTLHEIERQAYDLGEKQSKVMAVIMMPVAADTMEDWQQMAADHMPAHKEITNQGCRLRRIEPDIEGDVPTPDLPGEEEEAS